MVKFPDVAEMEELKSFKLPNSLSVYAPYIDTDSTGENPNRIAIKNLLKEAHDALAHHDVSPPDIKKTLRPAYELLESREFWPTKHESLVLFMHPKFFRYYHLPKQGVPAVISIRKGFNLVPLNEVMQENKSYYVLALSHNDVQLFEGNQFDMKPVTPEHFPHNMKKELQIDEFNDDILTHSVAPPKAGRGYKGYHGHFEKHQTDKDMLQQFFRRIDRKLHELLKNKKAPLVLAGVDYLLPIYEQINTYPHLLKEHIVGNLEHVNINLTREKAWAIVR